MQVAFRVIGNDATITRAAEGELDLNVWESIILESLSESIRLMRRSIPLFVSGCVAGIDINTTRGAADASSSLALSTALAEIFGYSKASIIAKHAETHGMSISEATVECGLMNAQDARRLFGDVSIYTDFEKNETLIDGIRQSQQAP